MGKIVPPDAAGLNSPGPFSQVLVVPAGEVVVISGQGPIDDAGKVVGATIEEQSGIVLDAARRLLGLAGADLSDVFKVNVYLADLADWPAFNDVYRSVMPEPRPVRTAIGCALLFGMKVEIDLWATRSGKGS